MKLPRGRIASLAVLVTAALLSACTPEQLASYTEVTGHQFTEDHSAALIALDDAPMALPDGRTIDSAGLVSAMRDPQVVVNGLPYTYKDQGPVLTAFRLVAASRVDANGQRMWSDSDIESWITAVDDITYKEAQSCWNLRAGAKFANGGAGCAVGRQGRGDAAGFGQITNVIRPITCERAGICSIADTLASPWNSMMSVVVMIEASGVSPWCYNSFARRFHRTACNNPGNDVG